MLILDKDINNSNSPNNEDNIFEVNQLDLSNILDILIRRKKIFLLLLFTFFSFCSYKFNIKRLQDQL